MYYYQYNTHTPTHKHTHILYVAYTHTYVTFIVYIGIDGIVEEYSTQALFIFHIYGLVAASMIPFSTFSKLK